VDPSFGLPIEPTKVTKVYNLQVAAILQDVVNLNRTGIKGNNKNHLRVQLSLRMNAQYKFLHDNNSTNQTGNFVNTQDIVMFSKDLSCFKTTGDEDDF
jgi:hypothetical protein